LLVLSTVAPYAISPPPLKAISIDWLLDRLNPRKSVDEV